MSTIVEQLRNHFDTVPMNIIEREWNELGLFYENSSPTIEEFLISLEKEEDIGWKYTLKEDKIANTNKKPSNNSVFFINLPTK